MQADRVINIPLTEADYLLNGSGDLTRSSRFSGYGTCYKIQLMIATVFLLSGIGAMTYGIPALSRSVTESSASVQVKIDLEDLKFTEKVTLEVDRQEMFRSGILAMSGVFATLLSTGMLLGLAWRNIR